MGKSCSASHTASNADHIVNCGGLWTREVGPMQGINVPAQPIEHHYLITEKIDAVADHPPRLSSGMPIISSAPWRWATLRKTMGVREGCWRSRY